MAVTVLGNDPNHTKLHNDTTNAQTAVTNTPVAATLLTTLAGQALRAAQVAEVVYCMNTGRLNPATILSTLS